ncbi:MAG: MYXO-CTERM sorting domain-containing protein [Polyangia bacterium]|jgi:hypothetical protein
MKLPRIKPHSRRTLRRVGLLLAAALLLASGVARAGDASADAVASDAASPDGAAGVVGTSDGGGAGGRAAGGAGGAAHADASYVLVQDSGSGCGCAIQPSGHPITAVALLTAQLGLVWGVARRRRRSRSVDFRS